MELAWMMLANYAEAPPDSGVIYITGGGVDTVTATGPLEGEGVPEGIEAIANLHLAMRLLFHVTELGRERSLEIIFMDEDGGVIGRIDGTFTPGGERAGLPPSWPHGFHLVFPLVGMPLPRFGLYTINVQVDGQHLGATSFRLIKGY